MKELPTNGLFTYDDLKRFARRHYAQPFLLDRWVIKSSVNIFVGDSGLGKSPLMMQLACCVAAGVPFLGMKTQQARVMYVDAENGADDLWKMIGRISEFLELPYPDDELQVWSPNFDETVNELNTESRLLQRIRDAEVELIIVDPLRAFWPKAPESNEEASAMIRTLRRIAQKGTASIAIHHVRKPAREKPPPPLASSPHQWLKEAAGVSGLINHVDLRLGATAVEDGDGMLVGGYRRVAGSIDALTIKRVWNEQYGYPTGYYATNQPRGNVVTFEKKKGKARFF